MELVDIAKQLKELHDKIELSHISVSKVQSENLGDLKTQIALISQKQDDHTQTLDKLLTQTTKTNGRVNKLEGWQNWITGGITVISFLVIPLIVYVFLMRTNTREAQIEKHVDIMQK